MECVAEKHDNALVLKVKGRLDSNTAPDFEQECSQQIDGGATYVIVDFSELDYISSAGLRTILSAAKKLKAKQGNLALCCLQPMVHEVFTVSGFASYLPIHDTLEAALAQAG